MRTSSSGLSMTLRRIWFIMNRVLDVPRCLCVLGLAQRSRYSKCLDDEVLDVPSKLVL